MGRDIWLVAGKDLRIEWRSRVTISQVVPFAGLVLVLFGFAFNANTLVLREATSGLFWVTVLFVAVMAIGFVSIIVWVLFLPHKFHPFK